MEIIMYKNIEILVSREDNYLQVNNLDEISDVWEYLKKDFAGFEVMFCYQNSSVPVDFLNKINAKLLDDAIEMRVTPGELTRFLKADPTIMPGDEDKSFDILLVDKENFSDFAWFHDASNPDMYWTSKRIGEKMEMWRIFVYVNPELIVGQVMVMNNFEIASVTSKDEMHSKRLITIAATDAFSQGSTQVVYLINKTDTLNQLAAKSVGFVECGFYKSFKVDKIG